MHKDQYVNFSPFLDLSSNWYLLKKDFKTYYQEQSTTINHNFKAILKRDFNYTKGKFGGPLYYTRSVTDSILRHLVPERNKYASSHLISEINLQYLRKIIDLCKANHKTVYLIRMPIHPSWSYLANEKEVIAIQKSRFADVQFLDFKNFPIQNIEFSDLEHLNVKGQMKFTEFFKSFLHDNILTRKDVQKTIDSDLVQLKAFYQKSN